MSYPSPIAPRLVDWRPEAHPISLRGDELVVLRVELDPASCPGDDDPGAYPGWSTLSAEEQSRALRFIRPRDRRRFAVCRGALRMILGGLLGLRPDRIAFQAGPGGKPELAPLVSQTAGARPRFNVSHSHELALVALSLERELGIDVERVRPISTAERIVESYFTSEECSQFFALPESARDQAFLRGWTRKEAVLKARGVGLAGLAAGFRTMFGTGILAGHFTRAEPFFRVEEWSLWEAAPSDQYVAALAVPAVREAGA